MAHTERRVEVLFEACPTCRECYYFLGVLDGYFLAVPIFSRAEAFRGLQDVVEIFHLFEPNSPEYLELGGKS